jgi:predicted ATPase
MLLLAVLLNRVQSGMIIMDEPESALSPQRQLALLSRMADLVAADRTQFIIATHSPVLLTFPEADIVSLDHSPIRSVKLEDTPHYQITRGILEAPERYWRLLRNETDEE